MRTAAGGGVSEQLLSPMYGERRGLLLLLELGTELTTFPQAPQLLLSELVSPHVVVPAGYPSPQYISPCHVMSR